MSLMDAATLFDGPLVTVSDVCCRAPRSGAGPEKVAARHELVFVRRGVFVAHLGRRQIVADPAQVLCLNRGEPVRYSHPTDGGDVFTALELPTAALLDVAACHEPHAVERPETPLPVNHAPVTPALLLRTHLLRRLLREAGADALAVEDEALHLVSAAIRAGRELHGLGAMARRADTRRAMEELTERTRLALATAPGEACSLATLAHTVEASPFRLARIFRHATGLPIHQYRLRLRLAIALDRLAQGEDNLSALGHELGFSSHSHFSQTFRAAFGASPAAIRGTLTSERHRRLRATIG